MMEQMNKEEKMELFGCGYGDADAVDDHLRRETEGETWFVRYLAERRGYEGLRFETREFLGGDGEPWSGTRT
jgi:hypothetical protein